MSKFDDIDDPRRAWLIRALSTGMLAAGWDAVQAQSVLGSKPGKLPEGQSIFSTTGDVRVNGKAADRSTPIKPGDTVQTGPGSQLVFAVGTQAMILRGDSNLTIQPPPPAQNASSDSVVGALIGGLRLLTGKLLSVSRNSPMRVITSTATVGIRGTGFYIEADPVQTYFCTCYGVTDIQASDDPESRETVAASHHDRPLYIVKDGGAGRNIRNAPFVNHTDQELALIEAIVGRTTPFVFSKDAYTGPRKTY
jgi:hypothetical protein